MPTNVEQMIIELDNREQIKELRYRYCRSLDAKDFDAVEVCFTEDALIDFGPAGKYQNRKELMDMFNQFATASPVIGLHVVSNPIIEFIDDSHAKAEWVSSFTGHDPEKGSMVRQNGVCFDEYVKSENGWQIKGCTYQILFHDMQSCGAGSPIF